MNFWTTLYYGAYLFGVTDAGMNLVGFCVRHPDAAWDVVLFCLCGAFGQVRFMWNTYPLLLFIVE